MMKPSYRNPECVESIIRAFLPRTASDASYAPVAPNVRIAVELLRAAYAPRDPPPGRGEVLRMLAEGVEVDSIYRMLRLRGIDPGPVLLAALQCDDFTTIPKIHDLVRSVQKRHDGPGDSNGVNLFTDDDIFRGDQVLLRLLPPAHDSKSALVNYLTLHPRTSKGVAKEAVRNEYGIADLNDHAFALLWPECREAAGLKRKASPGPRGPRRKIGKRSI